MIQSFVNIRRLLFTSCVIISVRSLAFADGGVDFFENKVRPIFSEHCYSCHGPEKQKAGLRLDTTAGISGGGDTGPLIVPGKPDDSLIVTALSYHDKDFRMPPPEDGKSRQLAAAQVQDVVTWINSGAPLPAASEKTSKALHWAFQPLTTPEPPAIDNQRGVHTEIDAFVLAKLEAAGLFLSMRADKRTLIRRATFDLTGLPPTGAEERAFLEDSSPTAFATVVDRLLASPRYGEQWGRHWLDVARYSDTKGYVYGREERFFVHSHVYRDWVIQALNADLPYDRFLALQIAADQMVPRNSPDLAAMGFLTGGRRFNGVTHEIIDDRIDVVTRGTMALTVQCARCHDHKYDPIPTRDYYSLYGVFRASAERLERVKTPSGEQAPAGYSKGYEERANKLADRMRQHREEAAKRLRVRVGDYLAAQLELQKYPEEGFDQILGETDIIPASVRRWRDYLQRTKDSRHPIFAPWHVLQTISSEDFSAAASAGLLEFEASGVRVNPLVLRAFKTPPASMKDVVDRYAEIFALVEQNWTELREVAKTTGTAEPSALPNRDEEELIRFLYGANSPTTVPDLAIADNELFFSTSACEELWKLQGEVDRWIINTPGSPAHALVLIDREAEANPHVFRRGNPGRRGEEVPRRFLSIVAGENAKPFEQGSGRLELARAIANPQNPLTARVAVNRVWMHHFGAGLVRTPSDFGLRAEPPSHPELLDWLAQRFIADGWSLKKLHRLIMLSSVYQQSSAVRSDSAGKDPGSVDPDNRLLWRFNRQRLGFEQMRDALLASSGELEQSMGGKPADMFSAGEKRRSIYGLVDRQFVPATFRVFDFANPDIHTSQRHETTIPQQGLFFLNDRFVAARSKAMLVRPEIAESTSDEDRVRSMYEACLQRAPSSSECARALEFVKQADATIPVPPKAVESAWRYGWGEYEEATQRMRTFNALPHFTGSAWQGGDHWPDKALGWVQLTAEGGHAGNDLQHAAIRRWTAPRDMRVAIRGSAVHGHAAGDGIRALVISSAGGLLKSAKLHNTSAEMVVPELDVKKGDTIDFVVDFAAGLDSDMFQWAPTIATCSPAEAAKDEEREWDALKEFGGMPSETIAPLKPWEQLAQVLLLSNEFYFID